MGLYKWKRIKGYLKGIIRVCFTLKDKEQDKEKDKDMNKAELIKFLKVS
jgi:hypothetical protein